MKRTTHWHLLDDNELLVLVFSYQERPDVHSAQAGLINVRGTSEGAAVRMIRSNGASSGHPS